MLPSGTLRLAAVAAATALSLPGQTRPGLIGLTNTPPAIIRQAYDCQIERCDPAFPATTARVAGGTAYDAILGAVWVTNGTTIAAYDSRGCRTVCAPQPLVLPNDAVATGLAVNERARVMVVTDSTNVVHQYPLSCPLGASTVRCSLAAALPVGHVIGGVATDDVNDHVLVAASSFTAANAGNVILVARRANACQPHCRIPVPSCGPTALGPITGLAFDPCANVIWATDGVQTVGLRYSAATPCQVTEIQCCRLPATTAMRYVGLCIEPSQAQGEGRNCQNGICANCPLMAHTAIGDAALGNPGFALELSAAPANAQTWLIVGAGACDANGPLIPPICGPILVPYRPILPIVVGPIPTGGTVGCTGSALVRVPIPLDRTLCGAVLSSQYLGLCTAGPAFGTFVSNCLSWMVSGT